jgi:secondary thiamine-phosphate synthase enzyme
MKEIKIGTHGEKFYSITQAIKNELSAMANGKDGVLTIFCPHTSCAMCLNENYDSSAQKDMENFIKHLAPRNLGFITHTAEGPDDSPSHMKSILLQSSIQLIVQNGELMIGTWQGIYLCEFRDAPHTRKVWLNFSGN